MSQTSPLPWTPSTYSFAARMQSASSKSPHCHRQSPAWTLHENAWWVRNESGEWRMLGEETGGLEALSGSQTEEIPPADSLLGPPPWRLAASGRGYFPRPSRCAARLCRSLRCAARPVRSAGVNLASRAACCFAHVARSAFVISRITRSPDETCSRMSSSFFSRTSAAFSPESPPRRSET